MKNIGIAVAIGVGMDVVLALLFFAGSSAYYIMLRPIMWVIHAALRAFPHMSDGTQVFLMHLTSVAAWAVVAYPVVLLWAWVRKK
jgi:hypothetical protein